MDKNKQTELIKQLKGASFDDERFTNHFLETLKQKLTIEQVLYFYDIAIKHQFIQTTALHSKLRNEITLFPLNITNDHTAITSLPYFRETLSENGKPCHLNASRLKKKWLRVYNKGKIKLEDIYWDQINPEGKEIIKKILKTSDTKEDK